MNAFHKKIKELNKGNISWIVLWILAVFAASMIFSNYEHDDFKNRYGFCAFAAVFLLIEATLFYIRKNMMLFDGDGVKRKFGEVVIMITRMENLMKLHSFDVRAYFGILSKELIPAQVISMVLMLIFGIAGKVSVSDICFIEAGLISIPQLTLLIYRKVLEKNSMNEVGLAAKVITGFMAGILGSLGIVISGIMAILVEILVLALGSSNIIMKGIEDASVARVVTTNTGVFLMASLISMICLVVSLAQSGNVFNIAFKQRKKLRILLLAILLISSGLYIFVGYRSNIRITQSSITVKDGSLAEPVTYDIDRDVKDFRIYENDEAIKMNVTFTDGSQAELIGDSCEDTNGWSERYRTDYNFIADLTGRLKDNGVQGTFDDREALKERASMLDPACMEGLEEIETLFEN